MATETVPRTAPRTEALKALEAAVTQAYRSGADPREVQQAIEFGCHDASRLDQARLASMGFLIPELEFTCDRDHCDEGDCPTDDEDDD